MLKRKPKWMSLFFQKDTWVTIYPHIYVGEAYWRDPSDTWWTPLIAHELVHMERQRKLGKFTWLLKYLLFKRFRFREELQAIAAELQVETNAIARSIRIDGYAHDLAGPHYRHCAKNVSEARFAIINALAMHTLEPFLTVRKCIG